MRGAVRTAESALLNVSQEVAEVRIENEKQLDDSAENF